MKSWKLGRLAGIDVYMHWTFLLLLGWVGLSQLSAGLGTAAAVSSMALLSAVFGCVLLHELGHALAARMFGVGTRDITLLPIGGVARLERMPEEPGQELVVALAGPAVNVAIAGLLALALVVVGGFADVSQAQFFGGSFLAKLLMMNVVLAVFNMLPAFPMDGGRVLRSLLAMVVDRKQATNIAAGVGQMLAVGLMVLGLFTNWMLMLVGAFVFFGARGEAAYVNRPPVRPESLDGQASVRDAMLRSFRVLPAWRPASQAVDEIESDPQYDYPVVDSHGLLGMVDHAALHSALEQSPLDGRRMLLVGELMTPISGAAHEEDPLDSVVEWMRRRGFRTLPVLRGPRLVGLLSLHALSART